MSNVRFVILILTLSSACLTPDPLYCDEDTACSDPERSYCDVTGRFPASEGIGKTCIPSPFGEEAAVDAACEPGDFLRCSAADVAVFCRVDGRAEVSIPCEDCDPLVGRCTCSDEDAFCSDGVMASCEDGVVADVVEDCPLGCFESGERCNDIDPSNGLAQYLDIAAAGPDVVLLPGARPEGTKIRNGDGDLIDLPSFEVQLTDDGRDLTSPMMLRVYAVRSLEIRGFTGTGLFAFVSYGAIRVAGLIDLKFDDNGWVEGCSIDGDGLGGGGGGFGAAGGDGGEVPDSGGLQTGDETLEPLRAGCGGDNWYTERTLAGGAIQLVSRARIVIGTKRDLGIVAANGSGGRAVSAENQGAGGGSGGGVLLEAPFVELEPGTGIFANGGGGGTTCDTGQHTGRDGLHAITPAAGGTCAQGAGGQGGSAIEPAMSGSGSGGGGGSVGRIRINTAPGGLSIASDALLSPAASHGMARDR